MLTTMVVTVICLQCGREDREDLPSDMICTHILGVWQFLRFGVEVEKITAAFCIRCSKCMAKRPTTSTNDDDEFCEVERLANQDINMMNDIREHYGRVRLFTRHRALLFLNGVRPLIEMGNGKVSLPCLDGYHRHDQHP